MDKLSHRHHPSKAFAPSLLDSLSCLQIDFICSAPIFSSRYVLGNMCEKNTSDKNIELQSASRQQGTHNIIHRIYKSWQNIVPWMHTLRGPNIVGSLEGDSLLQTVLQDRPLQVYIYWGISLFCGSVKSNSIFPLHNLELNAVTQLNSMWLDSCTYCLCLKIMLWFR